MTQVETTTELSFEDFKKEVLNDYKIAIISRECSLLGRREVLTGKAKFGIFGDGKEVPQLAMAKAFKKGDFNLIPLGVGMKLPKGYEAHIVPRSSTYKNFGIIQTNHQAVIDESYCGDNDEWKYPSYALRDTTIKKDDRICQFRIVKKQPSIKFNVVDKLLNKNRGGFGSTGKQ